MSDTVYCYSPDYSVLKNIPGFRNPGQLKAFERARVLARSREAVPMGQFDLAHLKAIHKHLFQDVYAWAGEIRTVEINKSGQQFQFRQYIETGMADVHKRLESHKFLRDLTAAQFAQKAGEIMGDVNYIHPFREGNGRTQLHYLKQLGAQAGHSIDLRRLNKKTWIEASRQSHKADYKLMGECIGAAIGPRQSHKPDFTQLKRQSPEERQRNGKTPKTRK